MRFMRMYMYIYIYIYMIDVYMRILILIAIYIYLMHKIICLSRFEVNALDPSVSMKLKKIKNTIS
jgi:hypothetical protein